MNDKNIKAKVVVSMEKKNFSSLVKTMSHKELDKTIDNVAEILSDLRDFLRFIYPYRTDTFFTFDKNGSKKFQKLAKEEMSLIEHRPFSGSKYLMNREFDLDSIFSKVSDALYRSFKMLSTTDYDSIDFDDAMILMSKFNYITNVMCHDECLLLDKCFLKEDLLEDGFKYYHSIYLDNEKNTKVDEESLFIGKNKDELIRLMNIKYSEMMYSVENIYKVFLQSYNDLCVLYLDLDTEF